MKLLTTLLPLAALSTAFVIPDEQFTVFPAVENNQDSLSKVPCAEKYWHQFLEASSEAVDSSKNALDELLDHASEAGKNAMNAIEETFDAQSWLDSTEDDFEDDLDVFDDPDHRPSHPPHHKPPHHRKPKHPHHEKPNMTVYQLIAKSQYTTKLAALIDEFDDLVQLLNGTAANYTVFAPTDRAFEKIPHKAPKPPKEFLKKLLKYHVSSDFYPAGRILVTRTIPTLFKQKELGDEPQRLSTNIGLRGLTVNFYARVVAPNIFGTNGVIHGIDSILLPPPKAVDILDLLPGEFSTLDLALEKTGLYKVLNDTSNHVGGTLFAPSNFAFKKLGPRINAFLFSKYGEKYLKALLKYHVVANHTLYSDAYYKADSVVENIPKGVFHVDLPTLLDDKYLSIDVARWGRFIKIKINAFSEVVIPDGIAKDGVIHVVSNVLIPPKKVDGQMVNYAGEDMTEEELMERLEPLVSPGEL